MAKKQTNKERLKEITDSIESSIQGLFQSEKYSNCAGAGLGCHAVCCQMPVDAAITGFLENAILICIGPY